jgi:catechol 2,3-dioxygenase-like lactoylglutathione lyase family enzyme
MQGFIGVTRIYLKHAAILLATGLLFQLAALHSRAQDKPKRPRITGIDRVRLYVSDLGKSRDFYSKLVGVRVGGSLCSDTSHPCFTVGNRQNYTLELVQAPTPGTKNWLAEIDFDPHDVTQVRRYLLSYGLTASRVSKDSYNKHAYAAHFEVRDPEGNAISFVQRFLVTVDDFQPDVRILHAGFVVKDMAAENRFYVDLLGFKLYWYGGFKDDGVDWYEIQVSDGPDWIEYMLNIPVNADHKELGVQNHFSLGVKDANAAAAQLRKNGLQKFDGPEIGRDGKHSIHASDPDGTRVEIMEFTPTQKPCCHPYSADHPKP